MPSGILPTSPTRGVQLYTLLRPLHRHYCRLLCQASFTAEPSSTASYPIVDPYGDHALGCRRSLPHRTTFWHDPLRDAYASIGRMVGLRTRTEVTGMIPDNSKIPDFSKILKIQVS